MRKALYTPRDIDQDFVRDLIERHSDELGGNGRNFHNGAYVDIASELREYVPDETTDRLTILNAIDILRRELGGYQGQLKACNDLQRICEKQRKRIAELEVLYAAAKAERTCHDVAARKDDFTCSECGASVYTQVGDCWTMISAGETTADVMERPNYCPNCGAKVVK